MVADIRIGDIVSLRKPHPCGSLEWEVVRVGADMRIRCTGCERLVMVSRSELEKRTRTVTLGRRDRDR
jgi:hypothetical protein